MSNKVSRKQAELKEVNDCDLSALSMELHDIPVRTIGLAVIRMRIVDERAEVMADSTSVHTTTPCASSCTELNRSL